MLLPLGIAGTEPRRAYVTFGTMIVCVALLLWTSSRGGELLSDLAFDPEQPTPWSWLVATYLHVSWMHVFGNMLFLLAFGSWLETHLRSVRFLLLYLACAFVGDLAYVAGCWLTDSFAPVVGASGAISGLMGYLLVAAPQAKVIIIWRNIGQEGLPQAPIKWFMVVWLISQVPYMIMTPYGGVAWEAHIGGFVAGVALARWSMGAGTEGTYWHVKRPDAVDLYDHPRINPMQAQAEALKYWRESGGDAPSATPRTDSRSRSIFDRPAPPLREERDSGHSDSGHSDSGRSDTGHSNSGHSNSGHSDA